MPRRSTPLPIAPMIGRDALCARIVDSFDEGARLVTLVGPPGIGKTHLARAVYDVLRQREGEAAWVELETTDGSAELCARVADVLGLRLSWLDPTDIVAELGWAIGSRGETTMVLDEAEGCLDAAAEVLTRWLTLAPGARALITSQERLGIAGETLVEVGPLEMSDAARLLAQRAGLERDQRIEELARRLDGIPLAIELVAARLHLLDAGEVLERLDEGLEVMEGGRRDKTTLRGAIAASWKRLSEPEREALSRCSIFEGSFRADAAEAVIGDDALDVLQGLRDKSLLARHGRRHRLYAPVRAFAREALADEDDARAKHAAHFSALSRTQVERLRGPEGEAALRVLIDEVDDLRAARLACGRADARWLALGIAEVALTRGPTADALSAIEGIEGVDACRGRALEVLGRNDEAVEAYGRALEGSDDALVSTWLAHAELARGQIDAAAKAVERSVEIAAAGSASRVEALRMRGVVHHARGHLDDAFGSYDEGRALADELGLEGRAAQLRADIGSVRLQQRRFDEARACYVVAVAGLDENTDPIALALAEGNLAILEQEQGDLEAAGALHARALERMRRVGHRLYAAHLGGYAGALEHERGNLEAATDRYRDALDVLRRVGDARLIAVIGALLGAAESARGRVEAAAEAFDEVERALAQVDDPGVTRAASVHRVHLELARARAGSTGLENARAEASARCAQIEEDEALATSDDLRLALRLLRDALGHGTLGIDSRAMRLTLPDGTSVDLARRAVLWRVVSALAAARRENPPRPLAVHDLLLAGWPGEAPTGESGNNRVKVALSTLRKLGLRELILRRDGGYLFDPDVPLL